MRNRLPYYLLGLFAFDAVSCSSQQEIEDMSETTEERPDIAGPSSGSSVVKHDWYEVPSNTLQWLNEHLSSGRDNRALGHEVRFMADGEPFAIMPIFQGKANLVWELHLADTTSDYTVWTKSEGIEYKEEEDGEWLQPIGAAKENENNTVGKSWVRTRPIYVESNQLYGDFYLYLKIIENKTGNEDVAKVGDQMRSDDGMMLSLDCPMPDNLDIFTGLDYSRAIVLGCEDSRSALTDWDMNDVVFLMVGCTANR